jgi:CheY-like chemotaxis protein
LYVLRIGRDRSRTCEALMGLGDICRRKICPMGVPPSFDALSGLCVLVVDDNEDARTILQSVLTYLGAFVSTAASAAAALNTLAQVKVDVVVCDVNLGDYDALWLIRHITEHQPDTPFIAVSGQDYDEYEMRLAGFTAFLAKPVQQDLLIGTILAAAAR